MKIMIPGNMIPGNFQCVGNGKYYDITDTVLVAYLLITKQKINNNVETFKQYFLLQKAEMEETEIDFKEKMATHE